MKKNNGPYSAFKNEDVDTPYSQASGVSSTPYFEASEYTFTSSPPTRLHRYDTIARSNPFANDPDDVAEEFELAELSHKNNVDKNNDCARTDIVDSGDLGAAIVPEGELATFANETESSTPNAFTRARDARQKARENLTHAIAINTPIPETHSETLMSIRAGHAQDIRASMIEIYGKKPLPGLPKGMEVAPDFRASRQFKDIDMAAFKESLKQKQLPERPIGNGPLPGLAPHLRTPNSTYKSKLPGITEDDEPSFKYVSPPKRLQTY